MNIPAQASTGQRLSCINHPAEVAVAVCQTCGRGLCRDCSVKYNTQLCDTCLAANNEQYLQKLRKRKRAYIIAAVIGLLVGLIPAITMINDGMPAFILMIPFVGYVFAAIVAGFFTFPKFNAVFGKLMAIPLAGWIASLVVLYIGLCVWVFVGLFTLPSQWMKVNREIKELEGQGAQ